MDETEEVDMIAEFIASETFKRLYEFDEYGICVPKYRNIYRDVTDNTTA